MLFVEGRFFVFFLVVLAVHWTLRSHRLRKLWLLLASYAFYAAWDWRFLSLILVSSGVDYVCGLAMGKRPEKAERRPWLLFSLVTNLGLLGFFKYFDFFLSSAVELAAWLGLPASHSTLGIVLPVGISFYTFQTMSYAIDVYAGRLPPTRDGLDFALFVAFFPQLVAGPIVRAVQFLPQLAEPRRFREHVAVRAALVLFLVGFVKKACVADRIAAVVDPLFADPGAFGIGSTWLGLALYHVQIYCDFSGYSDMAIATAGLLGYRLPENFAFPYFARSIGDFWRRWHISLATWMRDYLYLPLVARGATSGRRIFALYVTLGLCGLWHGAGWGFLGFGLLHGTYLVVEELWKRSPLRRGAAGRVTALLGGPALTLAVLLTWPVFRIGDVGDTVTMFGTLFGLRAGGAQTIDGFSAGLLAGFALVHWIGYRGFFAGRAQRAPGWAFAAAYGFAWSMALPWVATETVPFIYFQF